MDSLLGGSIRDLGVRFNLVGFLPTALLALFLSAALLMFIQTISTFEVPQLIGVPGRRYVFVSRIYINIQRKQ